MKSLVYNKAIVPSLISWSLYPRVFSTWPFLFPCLFLIIHSTATLTTCVSTNTTPSMAPMIPIIVLLELPSLSCLKSSVLIVDGSFNGVVAGMEVVLLREDTLLAMEVIILLFNPEDSTSVVGAFVGVVIGSSVVSSVVGASVGGAT